MKKSLNFLAIAAAATVLLSLPSAAKAQVTIRGPHGTFSIGGGPFLPEVGAYVPDPYCDQIYENGDYGYGFYFNDEWIPCERYGTRWVIAQRPVYGRGYGYVRPYAYGRSYGYVRPYSYGYSRPYGGFGRRDGFFGRRGFDGRRFERRTDGRSFRNDGRRNWDGRRFTDRRW